MDSGLSDHTLQLITIPSDIQTIINHLKEISQMQIFISKRFKEDNWESLYSTNENETDFVN